MYAKNTYAHHASARNPSAFTANTSFRTLVRQYTVPALISDVVGESVKEKSGLKKVNPGTFARTEEQVPK